MNCPTHNAIMVPRTTQYGVRYQCCWPGCTVACWSGSTSTPADDETRALRNQCHKLFDPLWKKRTRFMSRNHAYTWLRHFMDMKSTDAHIGMFNAEQCRKLLVELGGVPC
jgi:hypothetical protein